jgi:hypothetical protein
MNRKIPHRPAGRLLQSVMTMILCAALVMPALAERREAGADDPARKAQYLMRQMQAELQQAKAENTRLQAELDAQKGKQAGLREQLEEAERKLSSSSRRNTVLNERLVSDGDKYRELMRRYREAVDELRKARFKVAYMEQAVLERNEWIDTCRNSNEELYTINGELLEAYNNKGIMASLSQSMPVTGLARVRVENVVEDYRYRLEDLKMLDFTGSPAYETASVRGGDNGS